MKIHAVQVVNDKSTIAKTFYVPAFTVMEAKNKAIGKFEKDVGETVAGVWIIPDKRGATG